MSESMSTQTYSNATVVFDGYGGRPSTEDAAHLCRTRNVVGPKVNSTPSMSVRVKKEQFRWNSDTKQRFINLPSSKLQKEGFQVAHAKVTQISWLPKQQWPQLPPVLSMLSEKILHDLLVLLCHHLPKRSKPLVLWSEGQATAKQNQVWHTITFKVSFIKIHVIRYRLYMLFLDLTQCEGPLWYWKRCHPS